LKEVWKKNKDIVWITPFIINLYKNREHRFDCYMRKRHRTISFDANMNQKEPCVLGEGVNCETCGCIVPIMSHALKKFDIRAWFLFDKFYPERYYQGK